ncbi:hypothetical protein CSIM01_10297 [Colletotrichum simmondsii]|uniref:Uncharacterized protein n=1 Tax=Colletotrichum simmondsii TaxID=703756 RepID=A0A135TJG5_9PEZI|nr:hypothetical protein CSIM01_10297 [Colletotrichum simmondsii]
MMNRNTAAGKPREHHRGSPPIKHLDSWSVAEEALLVPMDLPLSPEAWSGVTGNCTGSVKHIIPDLGSQRSPEGFELSTEDSQETALKFGMVQLLSTSSFPTSQPVSSREQSHIVRGNFPGEMNHDDFTTVEEGMKESWIFVTIVRLRRKCERLRSRERPRLWHDVIRSSNQKLRVRVAASLIWA